LSIKSKLEFLSRAISYWKIYGLREFLRLAISYIREQVLDATSPLDAHLDLIHRDRVNSKATVAAELFREPFVALIGELSLAQCKKYRVLQKTELLSCMGIKHDYASWGDSCRAMEMLQFATVAIFYRLPGNTHFDAYLNECNRLGVRTIYDIDDPIFSHQVYSRNHNLQYLRAAEKNGLISGCAEFLGALERCDMLMGSTPEICALMERESGKRAYLWRNLVDTETTQAVRLALSRPIPASSVLKIGYASGSRAHEADFRLITGVVCGAMSSHENIELHILGHLELPPELQPWMHRITKYEFTDYVGYMAYLAAIDINLVPLLKDEFNECKSAIRYLEASLMGIPTIATAVGDFKNIVSHGETGFLAEEESDWVEFLERLILDRSLRQKVGYSARDVVMHKYSIMDEQYLGQIDMNILKAINDCE
jgi:hypothetical protein